METEEQERQRSETDRGVKEKVDQERQTCGKERERGTRETEEQVKQRSERDRVTEEGHACERVTEES